jgi:hypothetical protein
MHSEYSKRKLSLTRSNRDADAINVRENPAFNTSAKIAYFVFFIWMCASVAGMVLLLVREDAHPWRTIISMTLGTILVFGPIIGVIVWATRKHFRSKNINTGK